ncbi:penicillin-binding protein 2 [Candidatus Atribacteria bacterium MT.SAG.1]|nr:penicillin-binding protein 2 [Candidatus Atribacteria bacterium MT.SAG.1]
MKDVKFSLIFIFCIFVLLSLGITYRLFILQIKDGDYWQAIAKGQQTFIEESVGERGNFFLEDKNNNRKILAQNIKKNILYIIPNKIEDKNKTAEILESILQKPKDEILLEIEKGKTFKKEINDEKVKEFRKNYNNIKGLYVDEIQERFYPQNSLAASLIGFVNEAGDGQYGIEGYYNEIIKGTEGFKERKRSPWGFLTLFSRDQGLNPPRQGSDLILTLDYNIQFFCEKKLKEAKEKWDIDAGEIIVIEPTTGKIISLATFPTFNPNKYKEETNLEIFRNASTQKLFEPGSVFKAITMAAALEERLITPETTYIDKGSVSLGGPSIYNYEKRVWGKQTMTNVLEKSINTGAVFVQQELGTKLFLKYLEKFGLFEKTGIDLQAEEFSLNKSLKNGYPRDFASAAFGQGVNITSMQLIRAFSAIANGGNLMRPYIVEKIIKYNGEEIEIKPEIQGRVISKETSDKLNLMLVSVIEDIYARRAQVDGYFVAGKTGTAQIPLEQGGYSKDRTIHTFIGYLPADNPKFLILIKLENPKGVSASSYSAAPLFSEVAKYIVNLWQIPPEREEL